MKKALFIFGILFLTFLGFAQVTLPKLNKSPLIDLSPITNLSADYHNDTIILKWSFPETYQSNNETLSWSGEMSNQFGSFLRPNVYEDHAHRFDTLDLRNFIGWRIKYIGIIPLDSKVEYFAAVWLKEGDDYSLLYSEPLSDTILSVINMHELNQDIIIEAGKEYMFGWRDLCDPSLSGWSGFYNAADHVGPFHDGKSNMSRHLYEGWDAWPHNLNWCIQTILESPDGELITLNQRDEDALTGYRVYRDGQLLEEIGRRFQTYYIDHGFAIGETVTYSVTAMYGEMESEPVNISFTYDGLAESQAMISVVVFPNPTNDLVRIEDVTVADVQVYNALGQLVKTVQNLNEIDMGALSEGVYLLRITSTDGHVHIGKVALGK